ncbi:MAG: RNA polymerase sigma factor [Ignavibacteriales bacterium]
MKIEKLVIDAKNGDKEALLTLVLGQQQEYYRMALVYMKNREDALDALENMIVILYEKIPGLKKNEAFYSWSKTILVNCCKEMLRKRKNDLPLEAAHEIMAHADYQQKDEQILLDSLMTGLNSKHREVLQLKFFLDMDYQSIADLLKIPVGTVKSRVSVGLRQLRESLEGGRP